MIEPTSVVVMFFVHNGGLFSGSQGWSAILAFEKRGAVNNWRGLGVAPVIFQSLVAQL